MDTLWPTINARLTHTLLDKALTGVPLYGHALAYDKCTFNTHPIGQSVTRTTSGPPLFWSCFGAQFNARLTHTLLDKALPGPPRDHLDMHVGVRLMYV